VNPGGSGTTEHEHEHEYEDVDADDLLLLFQGRLQRTEISNKRSVLCLASNYFLQRPVCLSDPIFKTMITGCGDRITLPSWCGLSAHDMAPGSQLNIRIRVAGNSFVHISKTVVDEREENCFDGRD
jgi:hypothetical protein